MGAALGIVILLGLGAYLLMQGNAQNVPAVIDPSDPSTWPSGDGIWDCCQAIAVAEGYGVDANNRPTRNHNPGDISDGASEFGADAGGLTTFPNDQTGWTWLYNKVNASVNGQSITYPQQFTIGQIAQVWTGGDNAAGWAATVGKELGVDPSSTFADYVGTVG